MNLTDYQLAVSRTMPDLGSPAINAAHYTLGIVGELEEYFQEKDKFADANCLKKEAGDYCWYIAALANLFELKLNIVSYDDMIELPVSTNIAWVSENIKKYLAYSKPIINTPLFNTYLNNIISFIYHDLIAFDLDFEEVLDMNIAKLKLRYPEQFDAELAVKKLDEEIT